MVPTTTPGGKPGSGGTIAPLTPRSPVTTVPPVLVTVEAPRTAKGSAKPSDTWANAGAAAERSPANEAMTASRVERRKPVIARTREGLLTVIVRKQVKSLISTSFGVDG
jgi:hypothetical protein